MVFGVPQEIGRDNSFTISKVLFTFTWIYIYIHIGVIWLYIGALWAWASFIIQGKLKKK